MKRLFVSALVALSLAACTTPTVFQPATGPDGVGYSEYRIEPGRYRVMFRGGSGASPALVMDYALMRAANLALADGYDWFRVSDRFVNQSGGYGSGSSVSMGVGGASFGRSSSVGVGLGSTFDLSGGPALTATIEVFMGKGPRPDGLDVYDAHAVRSTLGRPAA